jgi:hypothetical protein
VGTELPVSEPWEVEGKNTTAEQDAERCIHYKSIAFG